MQNLKLVLTSTHTHTHKTQVVQQYVFYHTTILHFLFFEKLEFMPVLAC